MKHDPVHLFDHQGRSILTQAFQTKRIADLERENERLRRIIRTHLGNQASNPKPGPTH